MIRIPRNAKGWTRVGEPATLDNKALGVLRIALSLLERENQGQSATVGYSLDENNEGGTVAVYKKADPLSTPGGSQFED